MIAWMFPGQGSQRPGMAGDLEACDELFEIAAEALDADLGRICTVMPTNGSKGSFPADLLQPALYVTATGASRALSNRGLCPDAVVGHSLGEYAALTAAGALAFEDGLRLVSLRGKAMLAAARRNPGGMAAVIGLGTSAVKKICDGIDGAWVANLNSPTQTVMSGTDEALAQAAEACKAAGARRVVRLEVPIPGHCPLMEPAALEVRTLLADIHVKEPICPFYSCVDAQPHTDPAEIKTLLLVAMTSSVRFFETLTAMQAGGVTSLVEVGPARVLCGLARSSVPDLPATAVGSDAEAEAFRLVSTEEPDVLASERAHERAERVVVDD
jgi:[acyl-carrier-protein] S-malonyltransferase